MKKDKETELAIQYRQLAYVRFAYHYYTICEMAGEGYMENPYTDYHSELESLNRVIPDLLEQNHKEETADRLRSLRRSITEQVEILSAYTDQLQIYEYIFNRLEFRFEEKEPVDPMQLADDLFQYIFADRDSHMIYDKLSLVLSQLPVRMTRARFYDMLRECLSVYAGSSRDALDDFIANLKQLAMVTTVSEKPEFRLIRDFLRQCRETDYKEISHEEFHRLRGRFADIAQEIETCVNGYMQLQELCNVCTVIALTDEWEPEDNRWIAAGRRAGAEVFELFQGGGDIEKAEVSLGQLEGLQERGLERIMALEAALPDKDPRLEECELLLGSSIFVDPSVKPDLTEVDDRYLRERTEQFLDELSLHMKKNQKMVNRAIMATILGSVPNTFTSQQEIYDYIRYTLTAAGTEEQIASKELLTPIMAEE